MKEPAAYFISADDDFTAANRAAEIYQQISKGIDDEMSLEVIEGSASKTDDAVSALDNATAAVLTPSLFGGKKAVWLRGVNFLSTGFKGGKAENFENALTSFCDALKNLDANSVQIVISASPVTRNIKAFKSLQAICDSEDFASKDHASACVNIIKNKAKTLGVEIEERAVHALAEVVAANTRMAASEVEKLANYTNGERPISETDVLEMVPIFGEGVFFDISNAFFSGDLNGALAALRRYFFANKNASARPIISSLQKQNASLIQLRALMDARVLSAGSKSGIERAKLKYADAFEGVEGKTSFSLFSQNPWYVSNRLAPTAANFTLKRLLDFQLGFIGAFKAIIDKGDDHLVMRELFIRCLGRS